MLVSSNDAILRALVVNGHLLAHYRLSFTHED